MAGGVAALRLSQNKSFAAQNKGGLNLGCVLHNVHD